MVTVVVGVGWLHLRNAHRPARPRVALAIGDENRKRNEAGERERKGGVKGRGGKADTRGSSPGLFLRTPPARSWGFSKRDAE